MQITWSRLFLGIKVSQNKVICKKAVSTGWCKKIRLIKCGLTFGTTCRCSSDTIGHFVFPLWSECVITLFSFPEIEN